LLVSQPKVSDPGRAVMINAHSGTGVGLAWEIDDHGREIPGTRVVPDNYKRALAAAKEHPGGGPPDPELIRLEPLPPILPRSTRPGSAPAPTLP